MKEGVARYVLSIAPRVPPLRVDRVDVHIVGGRHPYFTVRSVGALFGIHDIANHTEAVLRHFRRVEGIDEFCVALKELPAALADGLVQLTHSEVQSAMHALHQALRERVKHGAWNAELRSTVEEYAMRCYIHSQEYEDHKSALFAHELEARKEELRAQYARRKRPKTLGDELYQQLKNVGME